VEARLVVPVVFKRFAEPDPIPTWLDGSVRAVPAESFADVDQGQGGITRGDIIDDAMIAALDTFPFGVEVYIESEDTTDCLDDETPETEQSSHIWWRATVLGT
jgi:hypothetical protein